MIIIIIIIKRHTHVRDTIKEVQCGVHVMCMNVLIYYDIIIIIIYTCIKRKRRRRRTNTTV